MASTIWKTELAPTDKQFVEVPRGAQFLLGRDQYDKMCVWYRCDPEAPKEKRRIEIVGTGHAAPEDGQYVGTACLQGGHFMFHIFAW